MGVETYLKDVKVNYIKVQFVMMNYICYILYIWLINMVLQAASLHYLLLSFSRTAQALSSQLH